MKLIHWKIGMLLIGLIFSIKTQSQILIDLQYEIDNKSDEIYDYFGGREVIYEKRYTVSVLRQLGDRVNVGVNYAFNWGPIYPHLISFTSPPQNDKTYNKLGVYGDFDFLTRTLRPYIFNNTGVIFDYPKILQSYRRENEFSINSQFGFGVKYVYEEKWKFRVQYSFGQVVGLKSFELYDNLQLMGFGIGYKL
tara:strand:- start:336 stop:914 length:579 start_codon:yes stop_codon:yes gene_type:complete